MFVYCTSKIGHLRELAAGRYGNSLLQGRCVPSQGDALPVTNRILDALVIHLVESEIAEFLSCDRKGLRGREVADCDFLALELCYYAAVQRFVELDADIPAIRSGLLC